MFSLTWVRVAEEGSRKQTDTTRSVCYTNQTQSDTFSQGNYNTEETNNSEKQMI